MSTFDLILAILLAVTIAGTFFLWIVGFIKRSKYLIEKDKKRLGIVENVSTIDSLLYGFVSTFILAVVIVIIGISYVVR